MNSFTKLEPYTAADGTASCGRSRSVTGELSLFAPTHHRELGICWTTLKCKCPVHTVPNGLDLDTIDATIPASRDSLGLPAGTTDPVILTASRLTTVKRVDLILSALAILRGRGHYPHLLICGSGLELQPLRAMATNFGLDNRVQFLGQRRDVLALMKAADLFCTASQGEGLPNSTLEAMACGLPILASDIIPHRDLLEPAQAGRLFSSESAESLANEMEDLLVSADLRRGLGMRGRAYSSKFAISRMCDQLNDLYRSLSCGCAKRVAVPVLLQSTQIPEGEWSTSATETSDTSSFPSHR